MTVNQLLTFNTFICSWKGSLSLYFLTQREPSLPVYLGFMIRNKAKDLMLSKKLLKPGLNISKHNLSQLSKSMGNNAMEANKADGMALPMGL